MISRASQIAVLDEILAAITANPALLVMDAWHSACGTAHCIAGWVQTLKGGDNAYDSGAEHLPDFISVFDLPTLKVREWLLKRAYALADGDFVKTRFGFMSNKLNTYPTLEEATQLDKTNVNCWSCHSCENCKHCDLCEYCKDCLSCDGCEYCKNCKHCLDCTQCEHCKTCADCVKCKDCLECLAFVGCEGRHIR